MRVAGRTRAKRSIAPSYFEARYRANIDPWGFRTSEYEQRKFQATIGALSRRRYHRVLELGCGIGVLSAMLAARCDRLLALDTSQTAIAEAKRQNLANADFEVACLPADFPAERFDLIVLSEFLYYFAPADLKVVAQQCVRALDQGGEMILCHWLGDTDNPLTGPVASDLFASFARTTLLARTTLNEKSYRLERLSGYDHACK
jgi:SAM-dependent methyltransferase